VTEVTDHLVTWPYPGAPEGDTDGYIDPAHFHRLFCAQVSSDLAAVMAVSQRGVAVSGWSACAAALRDAASAAGTAAQPAAILLGQAA
jgi:hypothetical protein